MKENIFINFVYELTKICPKLKISYKDSSLLMKALSTILFFNKAFKTDFTTVIGHTIYFPSKNHIENNPTSAVIVLAHEYMHIKDAEKTGQIKFALLYIMPQLLFLLIIPLAFIIGLHSLICFLFLCPLPAYWRKEIELKGYTMSLFGTYYFLKQAGHADDFIASSLERTAQEINSKQFIGRNYYFMWPFGVGMELMSSTKEILSGDLLANSTIHKEIKQALDRAVMRSSGAYTPDETVRINKNNGLTYF